MLVVASMSGKCHLSLEPVIPGDREGVLWVWWFSWSWCRDYRSPGSRVEKEWSV